jgi:hypothetical protein
MITTRFGVAADEEEPSRAAVADILENLETRDIKLFLIQD